VALTEKHETLTEVASLIFSSEIIAELPATINFLWHNPSKLPGYQTSQVLGMRVAQGYLYFALGADNLNKQHEQLVTMSRLRQIYRMTEGQIISQLAMLMRANVCTIDLSEITVTSLNKPISEPSISIASHESSVNHPVVSATSKGMMTSEMLASLNGLTSNLNSKQNLLTSSSFITVNEIVTTSQQAVTGATVVVTATSVISPTREARVITSTASLEMTASTPISPGVTGQKLTIINSGNFSIYIQALQIGLRSRSSASFIFINTSWVATATPIPSQFLGHNQDFAFVNGARVRLNDDYTFFIRNPAGVNQSQEMGSLGVKVSYERGIIAQDLAGFTRSVGYYRYNLNLGGNNVVLPGIISNFAEYKCF
jgi:hypothetical protein